MEERKNLMRWIKAHKTQLVFAGFGIAGLILVVLGLKNQDTLLELWAQLEEVLERQHHTGNVLDDISNSVATVPPFPLVEIVPSTTEVERNPLVVCRHIRNLPEGWHASPEKLADALALDIILTDGQTWVDSYVKGGTAA